MELRRKLQEAEAAAAAAQAGQARLRERCEAVESAAEEARRAVRAAKEEAAAASQGFEVSCWCPGSDRELKRKAGQSAWCTCLRSSLATSFQCRNSL